MINEKAIEEIVLQEPFSELTATLVVDIFDGTMFLVSEGADMRRPDITKDNIELGHIS